MRHVLRSRRIECSPALDSVFRLRAGIFTETSHRPMNQLEHFRDVDGFDSLPTTTHFVVMAGNQPVGAVRLLHQNPELARTTGWRFGVSLEIKYKLDSVCVPGLVPAEPSRFCVLSGWRNTLAPIRLTAALYFESRRWGISHWLTITNTQTDSLEDARLVYRLAESIGATTPWRVTPRTNAPPPEAPQRLLFTPEQRLRARRGDLTGLRFPPLLRFLVSKLHAKLMGEPMFDAPVGLCSTPTLIDLDAIPARTLAHFGAARGRRSRS